MSSDSEEENGVPRDAEDSDGGRYSRHSRSRSRSRSFGRTPPRDDDLEDDQQLQDRKENGMRGGGSDEYNKKKYDGQRNASRSKSPEKDAADWSAPPAMDDNKRASRSRSKSKPRDVDVAKEQKSSSSSSKKKTRTRRSRSRSRSKRRSRSRRRTRSRSRSYTSRWGHIGYLSVLKWTSIT